MATVPLRIGMLGGAFDPPHEGHRALAQAAVAQLQLDVLHVVPTGDAWHKTRTLTAAAHRLAMAHLAFEDVSGVLIDSTETARVGPSYTIDTLSALRTRYPGAKLYLVIGQDQAMAFQQWHRWQEITSFATICVAKRADSAGAAGKLNVLFPEQASWQLLDMPLQDASSTEVRRKLMQGEDLEGLVFGPVARYIALHHLYLTQAS